MTRMERNQQRKEEAKLMKQNAKILKNNKKQNKNNKKPGKGKKIVLAIIGLFVVAALGFIISEFTIANSQDDLVEGPQSSSTSKKKTVYKESSAKSSSNKESSNSSSAIETTMAPDSSVDNTETADTSVDPASQTDQTQADTTTQDQNPQSPDNWSAPNDNPEWDSIKSGFDERAANASGPIGIAGPVDANGNPITGPAHYDDNGNLVPGEDPNEDSDSDY